jgi:uroporphyrinogen decarboxylase
MADYEGLRPRLDGTDPARYPPGFDEELHWRRERGEIIGLSFPSFFGFPRGLMGLESWCAAFYEQPSLVERIIADRVRFFKEVYARILATRSLDFVQVWEDMAYKTASLISPAHVRRYMLPAYEEIVSVMRAGGVSLIMVDCDGYVGELLPLWREAGVDGTHPCEMAAGSDPFLLRRACPRTPLSGGMDKRVLLRGRAGVDAELARVMPLVKEGAFIPMLDHFVPPDMPWETYRYYVERRRDVLSRPGA